MKKALSLFLALLSTVVLSFGASGMGPEHFIAKYVPWGVDEFELFGLTKPELEKRFGKQLKFEFGSAENRALFNSTSNGPQFLITLDNGKVSCVRRMFIDGEGCHILGPILNTRRDALQFSIDGLSKLESQDPNDKAKLVAARKLFHETEASKGTVTPPKQP